MDQLAAEKTTDKNSRTGTSTRPFGDDDRTAGVLCDSLSAWASTQWAYTKMDDARTREPMGRVPKLLPISASSEESVGGLPGVYQTNSASASRYGSGQGISKTRDFLRHGMSAAERRQNGGG